MDEKDSISNRHQLLERQLHQKQADLDHLHAQLKSIANDTEREREVRILKRELKKKNQEVKLLCDNTAKLQELLLKRSDVPLYEMSQIPHGLAVVIVNGKFETSPGSPVLVSRKGALKDADCFSQTFAFLQYKVQVHLDATADDMRTLILDVAKTDHSKYDSFVCCISSHGDQEGIYGSDSLILHRDAFIDPIKSCASLRDKPKLFFFQACRVPVVSVDSPGEDTPSAFTSIHPDSDILIANASTEGNPAYTSLETGSWFANAIKRKFTDPQLVYVRTLQQLLEEVTDIVSQAAGQLLSGERVNQCVEITTRMRKGVKFL